MNMEQLIVGVSDSVILSIVFYLIAKNWNCSEFYWKIVEMFGENVITEQKVQKLINFATSQVLSG